MLYTTLNKIRDCNPCVNGWAKLLTYLGKTSADDEPLSFITILEANGLDDALWCCRSAPEYDNTWRLLAVAYVREVQHLMTDQRSLNVLDVAERHANGLATDDDLAGAGAATRAGARAAAWAAWAGAGAAAWAGAGAAAWAAWAGADAARAEQEVLFRAAVSGPREVIDGETV